MKARGNTHGGDVVLVIVIAIALALLLGLVFPVGGLEVLDIHPTSTPVSPPEEPEIVHLPIIFAVDQRPTATPIPPPGIP